MNFKKAVAAMIVGLSVGLCGCNEVGAEPSYYITPKDVEAHAQELDIYFTADDVKCTLFAKAMSRGVILATDYKAQGVDLGEDLTSVAYQGTLDLLDYHMEIVDTESTFDHGELTLDNVDEFVKNAERAAVNDLKKSDQLYDMYVGAYVAGAWMVSRGTVEEKDFRSIAARKQLSDKMFNMCLNLKDNEPESFKNYVALTRLAKGDF